MKFINLRNIYIAIIFTAALLRLYQLGSVPPSPDWDEAALGYNAYSVLKTGRDEYGTLLPLSLRSFDDYKPPLYMYLSIPSVALLGLNVWAVRFPSAIFGIVAVAGTYFLVRELFEKWGIRIGLLSSFLLALSPWHIQFSRIAFEANIGVTVNIWAVFSFLKGLRSRNWMIVSAFLFGLSMYAYHSERIFVPLLVALLVYMYRRELLADKKKIVSALIVGLITIAPLAGVFVNQNTLMRLRGTSSLTDQTGLLARSVAKLEQDQASGNPRGILFDNRRIVWVKTIFDGYLSHYSLKWLFVTGDNPRHHAPDMGLLYLWELPFFLYGLYRLFFDTHKGSKLVLGWFLIAPVAASPTTELPHAIRTLVFLPTFQIITSVGVISFAKKVSGRAITLAFIVVASFNVIYYLHMYFVHMNIEYSKFWQYGYKQAVEYAQANYGQYQKIVVSTKLEQPHIFFLFYTKYDPSLYLASGGTKSGGFAENTNAFDIYEFRPINWEKEAKDGLTLYIGTPGEISVDGLMTIRYLDGKEAIKIAD